MKINIKYFLFIIIVSIAWLYNANTYGGEAQKKCPAGCFCVSGGQISENLDTRNICGSSFAQRVTCWGGRQSLAFGRNPTTGIYKGLLACNHSVSNATYYLDDFYEVYKGKTGMYGFKGNELIVMSSTDKVFNSWGEAGIYSCPSSYPSSAEGAKSLSECYKYDKNGSKIYYSKKQKNSGSYYITGAEVLLKDLQQVLNKVNRIIYGNHYDVNAAKTVETDLQRILNKINGIVSTL